MATFKIVIPLRPRPKESIRITKFGAYNPNARGMRAMKTLLKASMRKIEKGVLFMGPVVVVVHYRMPIPKGVRKAKREDRENNAHFYRPDGDNLDKFLFDCCTGTVWRDDCQVSWILRSKTWTADLEGSIILYVADLGDKVDYEGLMQTFAENIRIQ